MSISRVLSSGFEVVVKTSGKQTLTQVFDEAGNLIKTRLKSVEKSVVPPIRQKKIGFAMNNGAESPTKNIFTITKNEYNHSTEESAASVLDRVYINAERVGERIISAEGKGNAMAAMKIIRHDSWDTKLDKVIRLFKDGKIAKENRYEFNYFGKRRSRYNVDFELEKEIESLKTKLGKIKFNDTEKIQKEISTIEAEKNNLLEKMEPLDIKVIKARCELDKLQRRLEHQQKEQKTAQTINKLLTQEFKTEEEFQNIMKEVENICVKEDTCENRVLSTIYGNYLEDRSNIPDRFKERLRVAFRDELETDYNAIISEINSEMKDAKKIWENAERAYNRKADKLKPEIDKLSKRQDKLEKTLNRSKKQNDKLTVQQAKLNEQLKELEAKREPLTLYFNGEKLRADIGGVDFTL